MSFVSIVVAWLENNGLVRIELAKRLRQGLLSIVL
jgi:hypothetical protein